MSHYDKLFKEEAIRMALTSVQPYSKIARDWVSKKQYCIIGSKHTKTKS